MATVWFILIALMLIVYVALDGFDFGAGIVHLYVARSDEERRTVLGAVAPVWDANEVWLIAAGGVSVFAFPRVYAAGFSGFYLPLIMVLWLLILRGLSIEFRSKEANPLWRRFWDAAFFLSSAALAVVFGAALGNLIRGVPLDATGYFAGPLFTNWQPGADAGVLDWYTIAVGILALVMLATHGALYVAWKTTGPVHERSQALARRLWPFVAVLTSIVTALTFWVQPLIPYNLVARPFLWVVVLLIAGSFGWGRLAQRRGRELQAFLASAAVICGLLTITAATVYPSILISTRDPAFSLTLANAAGAPATLRIGLIWWVIAIILTIGYFVYLFRFFAGKVGSTSGYH